MCSAFLPQMKARGSGHIINMGSVAGHHAYSGGAISTKYSNNHNTAVILWLSVYDSSPFEYFAD